ncbi:MAG: Glu-tRNA(Gln) amidotransferase subunit GatE [Bacteroidales bacterium]|jgi:glutamyl-tRNA(Gln) amidotransferase subunit E|nr:Glu-tRNA(Gln) amidotransferase subunit GatE [Bacteroidales bacterium]
MKKAFDPIQNYQETMKKAGYVPRKEASQEDYDRIGFMSGLEVHQQLLTKRKLFCHCPAGVLHSDDNYNAEIIRHMRPTLSELGEYDGTALMEFKTRKNITYRINNESACTYEIDDTPPFIINKEALEIALEISMLSKLNIVGEVHITRKQYLDGSIPAGFQRTAILGVEGVVPISNKDIRLIQLSIEEDSCREISDIGHERVYKTDRLGMPLIETVTYPDCKNPEEVKETCDYIRFLNRSTDKVRTGMGAARQDVNVSCKGGSRVEIKGVAHTKWIPELTHNEAFRQWSLLLIREELNERFKSKDEWKMDYTRLEYDAFSITHQPIKLAKANGEHLYVVKLPGFKGILSHFTQPEKCFADEITDRLKVIACIEKPNMVHTELAEPVITGADLEIISSIMITDQENDALVIFWAPEDDVKTALETIEERCQMAFDGVPEETRKSFENGTTIFERVLPGADRMYPDTDSAPIPLSNEYIDTLGKQLPVDVSERFKQLRDWKVPTDTYHYILSKNLVPVIEEITESLDYSPKFIGTFIGQTMKYVEGHYSQAADFNYNLLISMFRFIQEEHLEKEIAKWMLPHLYEHPNMDFPSILETIKFKRSTEDNIMKNVPLLIEKYEKEGRKQCKTAEKDWISGQLRKQAIGNMNLKTLANNIEALIK